MLQNIVRVCLPVGLDREYVFDEKDLNHYGLVAVTDQMIKRYPKEYAAIRPYMLPLKVLYGEVDYRKIAQAYDLQDMKPMESSRLSKRVCGIRDGKRVEVEVPHTEWGKYTRRKSAPSFVYQELPIKGWQDDRRVRKFFATETSNHLRPFQYFLLTPQVIKDWNVVFPYDSIPMEEPGKRSALFYYQTF